MRAASIGLVAAGFLAEMLFGLFVFRWPWLFNRLTFLAQGAVVLGLAGLAATYLRQRSRWGAAWAAVTAAVGAIHLLVLLRGLHLARLL